MTYYIKFYFKNHLKTWENFNNLKNTGSFHIEPNFVNTGFVIDSLINRRCTFINFYGQNSFM